MDRFQALFTRYNDVFNQVKTLLDVKSDKDTVIKFVLDKTLNDVSSYLHRYLDNIPLELDTTIISIALTYIETHNLLGANDTENISSLSEGDVQVQYKSTAELYSAIQGANVITDDYAKQLRNYRKLA